MIEEEPFIIETPEADMVPEEAKPMASNAFPVKTQLLLIGAFLLLIFAGFVVPKTIALLDTRNNQAEVQATNTIENTEVAATPQKIEAIKINATSAYVWDVVGQRVLFEKNPDEELPLASITKLMTALVAYELVPDNTLVTISSAAAAQQSGGSLEAGEVYKVKELADFALISSYNSAAYTLAASVGELLGEEDGVAQFIAAMNIRAEELNLPSLKYINPTGLDISATEAGATGNARDTTFLMEYILLNNPEILTPTVTEYTRLYNQNGDYHDAHNTNNILADIPNLLGSKTGYTDLAGGNLTIAFDAGYNRPVIVTVLGSTRNERFSDVKKLVDEVQKTISKQK
jgi:serine-type D-Ala-D-Ala carboxypeptidase (penicillin-binding protein 5/6)